jgi:hypothetical protein
LLSATVLAPLNASWRPAAVLPALNKDALGGWQCLSKIPQLTQRCVEAALSLYIVGPG